MESLKRISEPSALLNLKTHLGRVLDSIDELDIGPGADPYAEHDEAIRCIRNIYRDSLTCQRFVVRLIAANKTQQ